MVYKLSCSLHIQYVFIFIRLTYTLQEAVKDTSANGVFHDNTTNYLLTY